MRHTKTSLIRLQLVHTSLKSGNFPNSQMLAENLEVSRRTILRDIEFLRDRMRAPIEYSAVHRGYYYTEPTYMFPFMPVSTNDIKGIQIAENALEVYLGAPFEVVLKSSLRKINNIISGGGELNSSDIEDGNTFVFKTSATSEQDIRIFNTLSTAAAEKKQLKIKYYSIYRDAVSDRIIDPYHIVNYNGEWYLIAMCHLRKKVRTFLISRIREVVKNERTFEIGNNFDLSTFNESSFEVSSEGKLFSIKILCDEFCARYIREKKWHKSQRIVENNDETIQLFFKLNSLFEIKRWILSCGEHVKVEAPEELVAEIKNTSVIMNKLYNDKNNVFNFHI